MKREDSVETYFPVEVRYPGEMLDIRELVQPQSYAVKVALSQANGVQPSEERIWSCWDFVCREIEYPPAGDWHRREAFPATGLFRRALVSQTTTDFWSFPFETLSLGVGDCEDSSILLCSMLRNFMSPDEVCVTVGYFGSRHPSMGHAWVTINRCGQLCILETTLDKAKPTIYEVLELSPYLPYHKFNDVIHHQVQAGFVLGVKNKRIKQERMRQLYD